VPAVVYLCPCPSSTLALYGAQQIESVLYSFFLILILKEFKTSGDHGGSSNNDD